MITNLAISAFLIIGAVTVLVAIVRFLYANLSGSNKPVSRESFAAHQEVIRRRSRAHHEQRQLQRERRNQLS